MSDVAYLRWGETKASSKDVDSSSFGSRVRRRLLFDAVLMYEANHRAGTASTKGRSEVRGSGKKPFAQKHTGRARVGTVQTPSRRGGGVSGGPRPRDYSYSLPRKAKRAALQSALLSKINDKEMVLVDRFGIDEPKTKEIARFLNHLELKGSKLLVSAENDENLYLSARNIRGVVVRSAVDLHAYDVLRYRHLILTEDALSVLKERMVASKERMGHAEA